MGNWQAMKCAKEYLTTLCPCAFLHKEVQKWASCPMPTVCQNLNLCLTPGEQEGWVSNSSRASPTAAMGPESMVLPQPWLENQFLQNMKGWGSSCPTSQRTRWPSPWIPGWGALPIATRLCPVFVHLFCSPHFASSERGSCSSVNTIFESSHAVWAQILALIYCCVHFTALKSREFKSPLNTIGDTRRPVFWSSPINGYKFESRQQGSRAGKD